MTLFVEDDPNFYKRNSIFEEDHLDDDDEDEIEFFWWGETEEEEEERIQAQEAFRHKAEEDEKEYREYYETMNRHDAVYYGQEDYM